MACLSIPYITDESPRAWWTALGVSLVTHVIVLSAITAWTIFGSLELGTFDGATLSPEMEMTYSGYTSAPRGTAGTDPVENILESIPERIAQIQKLTPAQKAAIIKDKKGDLAIVKESSLHEIADLFDVENRAYAPADPRPAGAFDIDSQIPYSMKQTENGGYSMLLVDKAGRTLEIAFSAEEVTDDLHAAFEIFKMMDEMPGLRKAYMRMAVKFFPELTEKECVE